MPGIWHQACCCGVSGGSLLLVRGKANYPYDLVLYSWSGMDWTSEILIPGYVPSPSNRDATVTHEGDPSNVIIFTFPSGDDFRLVWGQRPPIGEDFWGYIEIEAGAVYGRPMASMQDQNGSPRVIYHDFAANKTYLLKYQSAGAYWWTRHLLHSGSEALGNISAKPDGSGTVWAGLYQYAVDSKCYLCDEFNNVYETPVLYWPLCSVTVDTNGTPYLTLCHRGSAAAPKYSTIVYKLSGGALVKVSDVLIEDADQYGWVGIIDQNNRYWILYENDADNVLKACYATVGEWVWTHEVVDILDPLAQPTVQAAKLSMSENAPIAAVRWQGNWLEPSHVYRRLSKRWEKLPATESEDQLDYYVVDLSAPLSPW